MLDDAETRFPNDVGIRLTRAALLGRMRRYDDALALIDGAATGDVRLGPNELLEKGRLLDQMGRYDDAWAAFAEGKKLARELSGQSYLDEAAAQTIDRLRNFFTEGRLRILPRAGVRSDVPQPIFILGFPALRHHAGGTNPVGAPEDRGRRRAAADPRDHRHHAAHAGPPAGLSRRRWPSCGWATSARGWTICATTICRKFASWACCAQGATRFTDKMPLNETHLGLIALLFPEAPLIHVLRHPLDIMVSAFSNAFTHGFYCAADLETAARHYVRVMDLVQHYRAEMTLRYLPVRYEDIVGDQDASVRAMLGFIGEKFDKACLTFHENRRYARTASYAQVAEPLYDRSVGRWKHYRAHLAPVIPILAPVIERLGYRIDDVPFSWRAGEPG